MIPYFDAHPNQAAAILITAMAAIGALLIRKMHRDDHCAQDTAKTRGDFDPLDTSKRMPLWSGVEELRPSYEGTGKARVPRPYDPATDVSHSNIGPGVE